MTYELVNGDGDTITCDQCDEISETWYSDGNHAVCEDCGDFYKQTTEGESGE